MAFMHTSASCRITRATFVAQPSWRTRSDTCPYNGSTLTRARNARGFVFRTFARWNSVLDFRERESGGKRSIENSSTNFIIFPNRGKTRSKKENRNFDKLIDQDSENINFLFEKKKNFKWIRIL